MFQVLKSLSTKIGFKPERTIGRTQDIIVNEGKITDENVSILEKAIVDYKAGFNAE